MDWFMEMIFAAVDETAMSCLKALWFSYFRKGFLE